MIALKSSINGKVQDCFSLSLSVMKVRFFSLIQFVHTQPSTQHRIHLFVNKSWKGIFKQFNMSQMYKFFDKIESSESTKHIAQWKTCSDKLVSNDIK